MIHKIFTVHDLKAGAYLPPFILPQYQLNTAKSLGNGLDFVRPQSENPSASEESQNTEQQQIGNGSSIQSGSKR